MSSPGIFVCIQACEYSKQMDKGQTLEVNELLKISKTKLKTQIHILVSNKLSDKNV